jgi:hypothetical protein
LESDPAAWPRTKSCSRGMWSPGSIGTTSGSVRLVGRFQVRTGQHLFIRNPTGSDPDQRAAASLQLRGARRGCYNVARSVLVAGRERHETTPPTISAPGRGRGRAAGFLTKRRRAKLSRAPGSISAERRIRSCRSPVGRSRETAARHGRGREHGRRRQFVGAAAVARAKPDGYTLPLGGTLPHINEALIKARPLYDPVKDLEPIAGITVGVLRWRSIRRATVAEAGFPA